MDKAIIIFIIIIFIDALLKHINILEVYKEGVKKAFPLVKMIFPTLLSFILFVQLLKSCGIISMIDNIISLLHLPIPIDIILLGILRPISANASIAYLYEFYRSFGVDHPLSLLATLIQCGSDTTLYVISLYFSSLKIKNTRYAVFLGLLLDFLAVIVAIFFYLKFIA